MAAKKTTKVLIKRKKFIDVEIPIIRSTLELIGNSNEELIGRTIKLDLTRQLKGKSVEAKVKIGLVDNKPIAYPVSIRLMPYFIRRMIRKRISYVEDSFPVKSQNSLLTVKPFLITRKRVSHAVRKTLRNKTKNWIEDYFSQKTDDELYLEILSNRLQRQLSLSLKKTYPLSLCEIRVLELIRPLQTEEIPKIVKKIEEKEDVIDQMKELEEDRIKSAEDEIKVTQKKALKKEMDLDILDSPEEKKSEEKPKKKTSSKKTKKTSEEETPVDKED